MWPWCAADVIAALPPDCGSRSRSPAVFTGDGQSGTGNVLANVPKLKAVRGHNAVYVFALPEKK